MGEFEFSVALTVLGALIGAVVAPLCELLLLRFLRTEGHRMKTGFVLLCAANALWMLSAPFFPLVEHHPFLLVMVAALYALSAISFIGAFRAFQTLERENGFSNFIKSIRYLAIGNFLWVVAEVGEAPLAYLQLDEFPYLLSKYLLLVPAAFCFALAAVAASHPVSED